MNNPGGNWAGTDAHRGPGYPGRRADRSHGMRHVDTRAAALLLGPALDGFIRSGPYRGLAFRSVFFVGTGT